MNHWVKKELLPKMIVEMVDIMMELREKKKDKGQTILGKYKSAKEWKRFYINAGAN